MQFITFISAAAAMVVTASAERSAVVLNQALNQASPYARVINRCSYDVHLWSVLKGTGCPGNGMMTLKTGESYGENYDQAEDGATGVSIKISKTKQCGGSDLVQLEYFLKNETQYAGNYLDVSYVDCLGGDCPTKKEGYYLQAGSQTGAQVASVDNTHCPILSCDGPDSCAQCSYINPDDTQTKFCDLTASLEFYLCGAEGPGGSGSTPASGSDSSSAAASSAQVKTSAAASSDQADYAAPSPTSVEASTENVYQVKAAAVTPVAEVTKVDQKTKTHVEIVYATVTAYEYANSKRHAHGHARRHQQFHA